MTLRQMAVAVVAFALGAGACGERTGEPDPHASSPLGPPSIVVPAPQEAFASVSSGAESVAESNHWVETPRSTVALMDRRLRAGGALVRGSLMAYREGPLYLEFEVSEVVAGTLAGMVEAGSVLRHESDFCCYPGLADTEAKVAPGSDVLAIIDDEGRIVRAAIRLDADRGWLGGASLFTLGDALNADWRSMIPDSCPAAEIPPGADTEAAIVAYAAKVDARRAHADRLAATDQAERLADAHGWIDQGDGTLRPVDERAIVRQLLSDVAPEDLVYVAEVRVTVAGDRSVPGDGSPDLLVLVDEATDHLLGAAHVREEDRQIWVGEPTPGSRILVYRFSSEPDLPRCNVDPDALARYALDSGAEPVGVVDDGSLRLGDSIPIG